MSPGRRPLLGKIRNDVTKVETYVKCRHCYGDRPLPTDQNGGTEVAQLFSSGSQEDFPARESLDNVNFAAQAFFWCRRAVKPNISRIIGHGQIGGNTFLQETCQIVWHWKQCWIDESVYQLSKGQRILAHKLAVLVLQSQ